MKATKLIRNYEHPGTDWKSTIKVGGKLARETLNKIRGEK